MTYNLSYFLWLRSMVGATARSRTGRKLFAVIINSCISLYCLGLSLVYLICILHECLNVCYVILLLRILCIVFIYYIFLLVASVLAQCLTVLLRKKINNNLKVTVSVECTTIFVVLCGEIWQRFTS